ncbi:LysR family transcriptional regulator [Sphingopyxis kveilinensis]|uniref:LysR family transcriptional regulator n=1 Tax=Sphingopyxis kveilinensis TaxID=3114367 RepID=UPI0030D29AE0
MDRFASLTAFVKVVETGSFTAAAQALEISGPMVGKHIQLLERRLGARLIHRTTRRQALTDFGAAYYERAKAILADMAAADALAESEVADLAGRLRVTMPVHFGRVCVAPVLVDLARRFPRLELDLAFSDHLGDLIDDGFDLAIRTGELAGGTDYLTRRLATQQMVVVGAPAYLNERGTPRDLADLDHHATLAYRRSGALPPWLFPGPGEVAIRYVPKAQWRFSDLEALAATAEAGLGLAWVPSWLVRERLDSGALVELLPEAGRFPYPVHALWLRTTPLPARIRAAIDALAAALPRMM